MTKLYRLSCASFKVPAMGISATSCISVGGKRMMVAAKAIAATGIDLINDPSIIAAAQKEFEKGREVILFIYP